MENAECKKTLGRRKIEIKKIEKKTSLQVTFSKRRLGLFRKASELGVLCGAEIAILVQSPADKIFAFGIPSVESVFGRFQMGETLGTSSRPQSAVLGEDSRSKYEEVVRRLEGEKETEKRMKEKETDKFWWDEVENFEGMELHELEEYAEALERLRDSVFHRLEEMQKLKLVEDLSNLMVLPNQDFDEGHSWDDQEVRMEDLGTMEKDSGSGSSSYHSTYQGFEGFEDFSVL